MDERTKKSQFLQLQLGALLAAMTLLPQFSLTALVSDGSSASFIEMIVRLAGAAFAGLALYAFYKEQNGKLDMPLLITMGGGLALAIITCIPGVPGWVEWFPLILLLVGVFLSRKALGVEWRQDASAGIYLILLAVVLRLYGTVHSSICVSIAALVGLVLYIKGLGKLSNTLDAMGTAAVSKLKIAVWLGIAAAIIGIIPLIGAIIGGLLGIAGFIYEFLGYSALRSSQTIGAEGQDGAALLRKSMIFILVASILSVLLGWIPAIGLVVSLICTVLAILSMWYMFKGWRGVLYGLER